jgi:solute carrier family 10 (sodium/bile acid cotransporter), member 7
MKQALVKRWFLVLLVGAVALALWQPGRLEPYTSRLPPLALVGPALFLIAWGLDSRSLWGAIARPLPALWAVVISYGGLPLLGWLAGRWLPETGLATGLMIITSVPCTLASAALWTRMAGGNEATALLVTLLTTGTSWLVTTAWLYVGTGKQVHLDPAGMMWQLFLVLVLPVAAGQLARAHGALARAAVRWDRTIGVASRLLILVVIVKAAVEFRTKLGDQPGLGVGLATTAAACGGIHLLALAGGLWGSRGLGFDRPSQIAVAFACSQKTLPVALFLFQEYYQQSPLAVVPLVFYHGLQLIVDTFIADRLAGVRRQQTGPPEEAGV